MKALDKIITSSVRCVVCGAKYGECDCWVKCVKCGRSFQRGKKCNSKICGGDGLPRAIARGNLKL